MISHQARIEQINQLLPALTDPALVSMLRERVEELTNKLVGENDEQTRGRIKALRDLLNLPEALLHERDGITAELPDTDSAY